MTYNQNLLERRKKCFLKEKFYDDSRLNNRNTVNFVESNIVFN